MATSDRFQAQEPVCNSPKKFSDYIGWISVLRTELYSQSIYETLYGNRYSGSEYLKIFSGRKRWSRITFWSFDQKKIADFRTWANCRIRDSTKPKPDPFSRIAWKDGHRSNFASRNFLIITKDRSFFRFENRKKFDVWNIPGLRPGLIFGQNRGVRPLRKGPAYMKMVSTFQRFARPKKEAHEKFSRANFQKSGASWSPWALSCTPDFTWTQEFKVVITVTTLKFVH